MAASTPARQIDRVLKKTYPVVRCSLDFRSPLELLMATILAAQCTDERVNTVTPRLFERWPTAADLAGADPAELEAVIRPTGFFHNKATSILKCARALIERHGGEVPQAMDDLTALPGVGRKTANVLRGNAFGLPGLVVDTHVRRLAQRMGLSANDDPEKIEADLCAQLPEKDWTDFSHRMVYHGRAVCQARKPQCPECPVVKLCPTGRKALEGDAAR